MNYPEVLEEAWRQHLAPREPDAPTVVSLFAGCGGSSLGYSMAGYRELLAVDFDRKCVGTFRLNFPGVPFLVTDLRGLSAGELMEAAGLSGPGELDLLDGSPPCQGFSTAGKRDFFDPRNQLYNEFARLLEGTRPKAFVMENVSGMVKGKMKLAFADCTRKLKATGYRVSCRLMDTKWFHVPQERKRLIWVGVREDLDVEPGHPKAKTSPLPVKVCFKSGGEMLKGVELERWQHIPPGGNWLDLSGHLVNGRAKYSNFHRRLHPEKPSFTVGREEHYSSGRFYHWTEPRRINDVELKRICSFPDGFTFREDGKTLHRLIGNSVPPLMMRAIALHIKELLIQAASRD